MNKLTSTKRSQVVSTLVEGCSIRSTVRMTGVAKNTVTKLLVDLGAVCSAEQDRLMRNLPCRRLQLDEIWSFCYSKQKNLPVEKQGEFGYGGVWTWVGMDAETKIVPTWVIGKRDAGTARMFIEDLEPRLANGAQITSDGLKVYLDAIDDTFRLNVDYAMLIKMFGDDTRQSEARYSPPQCTGTRQTALIGNPDSKHISTSYIERQNLTMRMGMRRFTRLTNAFSKRVENLAAAVSLHFIHCNFVRIHQTLRVTPAMAAGATDRLWSIEDIVRLLEKVEESN